MNKTEEKRPFFSVVIPLHNREGLIENTIRSVLSQSTTQEFEIIVIDDGSKDSSAEVVRAIQDDRLTYYYQSNAGANRARNHGIDKARGHYIAMLDSDDIFLPNHLQNAYEALQLNPNSVLYSRIIVDRGTAGTFLKPPRAIRPDEPMSEYLLCGRGFLQTSTVVLPAALAKKVRYDEALPYGQDTDFAIRLSAAGAAFQMIEEPGAIWQDINDKNRVSSKFTSASRLEWLGRVEHLITRKAFYGDMGWAVAKGYAKEGRIDKALSLYFGAVFRRCYSLRLSVIIGMQIVLGPTYRNLTDLYVSLKRKKSK